MHAGTQLVGSNQVAVPRWIGGQYGPVSIPQASATTRSDLRYAVERSGDLDQSTPGVSAGGKQHQAISFRRNGFGRPQIFDSQNSRHSPHSVCRSSTKQLALTSRRHPCKGWTAPSRDNPRCPREEWNAVRHHRDPDLESLHWGIHSHRASPFHRQQDALHQAWNCSPTKSTA